MLEEKTAERFLKLKGELEEVNQRVQKVLFLKEQAGSRIQEILGKYKVGSIEELKALKEGKEQEVEGLMGAVERFVLETGEKMRVLEDLGALK